jgi:fumarate reductase subunit D
VFYPGGGCFSSKSVYGNFLYISLVALLVFAVLLPLGILFANNIFMMALSMTVAITVFLVVAAILGVVKKKLSD